MTFWEKVFVSRMGTMKSVCYGNDSFKNDSSCIANFSLKQSAKYQQNEFSKFIVESVDKDFYIDDFLKSGEHVKISSV